MEKIKLGIILVFAFSLGAIYACGPADAQSGASVIPSPVAGYICFSVGTGGNCVRE